MVNYMDPPGYELESMHRDKPAPVKSVLQDWVMRLPMMQQSVLLTAIRGPDNIPKYHKSKYLIRWYRRCVLLGALNHNVFTDPADPRGGSFTGPSYDKREGGGLWEPEMDRIFSSYLVSLDELPHHFQLHFMHGAEILGYKHPNERIRSWWHRIYLELGNDMHLNPETEEQLDYRLGDDEARWRSTSHSATQA